MFAIAMSADPLDSERLAARPAIPKLEPTYIHPSAFHVREAT